MLTGEIRLIKYGVIPTLPYFEITVGRVYGGKENLQVVKIVREHIVDGKSEYHIQCARKDEKGNFGTPFVWATFKKEPDIVQYFAPDGKHDYLVI